MTSKSWAQANDCPDITAILEIIETPKPESYAYLIRKRCTMTKYGIKVEAYSDKYDWKNDRYDYRDHICHQTNFKDYYNFWINIFNNIK